MAKRVNFPKPLYLTPRAIEIFRDRFLAKSRINFFSDIYVYTSQNIVDKTLPYRVGEFNGICVDDSWREEKNDFTVFIISDEDYSNALQGEFSSEVSFFIDRVNKRQSLIDEKEKIITAKVFLVKESDFDAYYSDRKKFVEKHSKPHYTDNLFDEMRMPPPNELF